MATNDPKSRLTEGSLSSPDTSPNGVYEQQGSTGGVSPGATTTGAGPSSADAHVDSTGEKIGRFFRTAMDRIGGHENPRDSHERSRGSQAGRSASRDRSQNEWSDLGRSRDDRNQSDRAGPSSDTAGSSERLQGSQQGAGRPYGQGQGSGAQSGSQNRDRQTLGQRSLGRSPGEGSGLPETSDRQSGEDRGFEGGREDRSTQSGATGMSAAYAGSGASFGFGRDEQRDRDQGQGRRFWQREPLSARDVMTRTPKTVTRQTSIREAAVVMRDENCGAVPVVDGAGRLEGILTDRDIVVRGLVEEKTQLRVEDVMTDDVSAVTEDEPVTSVLDLMGRKQVRRVPVVDRNDRLLGIVSMADIANRADYDEDLQDAFERISSRRSFWSLFS